MSTTAVVASPLYLWDLYIEYLWNYQPGSWVERTASTFRVLALLVITPFAILTMLDVASYVIARTLGVVETTKASTGDVAVQNASQDVPSININSDASSEETSQRQSQDVSAAGYLSDGDNVVAEGNLRLGGLDAFSPAPSQPSSPTLSRRDLSLHALHQSGLQPLTDIARRARSDTASSSSGESKFTMLERDSGSDENENENENGETEGTHMRRRVRAGAEVQAEQ